MRMGSKSTARTAAGEGRTTTGNNRFFGRLDRQPTAEPQPADVALAAPDKIVGGRPAAPDARAANVAREESVPLHAPPTAVGAARTTLGSWGWLPALVLLAALGLVSVGRAMPLALEQRPGADLLFWLGLLLIYVPVAFRMALPQTPRRERIALAVWLGLALYLVKDPSFSCRFYVSRRVSALRHCRPHPAHPSSLRSELAAGSQRFLPGAGDRDGRARQYRRPVHRGSRARGDRRRADHRCIGDLPAVRGNQRLAARRGRRLCAGDRLPELHLLELAVFLRIACAPAFAARAGRRPVQRPPERIANQPDHHCAGPHCGSHYHPSCHVLLSGGDPDRARSYYALRGPRGKPN